MAEFERLSFDLCHLFLGGYAVLDHALHDPITAGLCRERETSRIVAVRCLGQTGEEGGFAECQLVERLVEIGERSRGHTIGAGTEINLVEVEFQNTVLGQRSLDPRCEQNLLDLAFDRNLVRQQHVLGDLLGDRRGADGTAVRAKPAHIGDRGAHDRDRVDAVMAVEVLVLGGKEGVDDGFWDRLDRHEDPSLGRVFGQEPAVAPVNSGHDRRLIMRELLVIGQVTTEIPECDPDESTAGYRQHHRADK